MLINKNSWIGLHNVRLVQRSEVGNYVHTVKGQRVKTYTQSIIIEYYDNKQHSFLFENEDEKQLTTKVDNLFTTIISKVELNNALDK